MKNFALGVAILCKNGDSIDGMAWEDNVLIFPILQGPENEGLPSEAEVQLLKSYGFFYYLPDCSREYFWAYAVDATNAYEARHLPVKR